MNILPGLIIIILGILLLVKPFVTMFINFKNSLKGLKTEITSYTIWYYRIMGIVFIICGAMITIATY